MEGEEGEGARQLAAWELCVGYQDFRQIEALDWGPGGVQVNWAPPWAAERETFLTLACQKQDLQLLDFLLKNPDLDPNRVVLPTENRAYGRDPGTRAIFERLLQDPRLDLRKIPLASSELLRWAMYYDDLKFLRGLLARPDFEANAVGRHQQGGLFVAGGLAHPGSPQILQLLLEDPRVDLSSRACIMDRVPLLYACQFGNLAFVQHLLASGRPELQDSLEHYRQAQATFLRYHLDRGCCAWVDQFLQDPWRTTLLARIRIGWRTPAADLNCLVRLWRLGYVRPRPGQPLHPTLAVLVRLQDDCLEHVAGRMLGAAVPLRHLDRVTALLRHIVCFSSPQKEGA